MAGVAPFRRVNILKPSNDTRKSVLLTHIITAAKRNNKLPPPHMHYSLGDFCILPIDLINNILSYAVAHDEPIRIRCVRQQKGQAHGQNFAIIPPEHDTAFRALSQSSRSMCIATVWNYLHANVGNEGATEVVMLWTAPPIPTSLRLRNLNAFLRSGGTELKSTFLVSRWMEVGPRICRCTMALCIKPDGLSIGAGWEMPDERDEDQYVRSVTTCSHPTWDSSKKEVGQIGVVNVFDVAFLWKVMRVVEKAGQVSSLGTLV